MEKKYRLQDNETIRIGGRTMYRIYALRDFDNIKKGDKGGYIEKESNLSHKGICWIYGRAVVFGNAVVCGNAEVCDNAEVCGSAVVCDNAEVFGNANVFGKAEVYNNAKIYGNAKVYINAKVCGYAVVCDNAEIFGRATVYDNAKVYGNAVVHDNVKVCGNAKVCGCSVVHGDAVVRGNAIVREKIDYFVSKNIWSSGRYFTYTHSNKMWSVGCFHGTGEELIKKAHKDSEVSGREYERIVRYVEEMYNDLEKDRRKNKKL